MTLPSLRIATGVALLLLPLGCAAPRAAVVVPAAGVAPARAWTGAPRTDLPLLDGRRGTPLDWNTVMDRIAEADVVLLGEQHDDAVGHALQLAVVEDTCARWPGSAVALEMLERDEQPIVDDFLDGLIDAGGFAELTNSASWSGDGSWAAWYQPVIDAALAHGGRVIAANAPRRYVRLARTRGYEVFDELDPVRRGFLDRPETVSDGPYWERFLDVMSGHGTAGDGVDAERTDRIRAAFRSQLVWDATMAASVVNAAPRRDAKVMLLVGQFHVEFEGGTVQEIRRRAPDLNVLVITTQRETGTAWRDEDAGIADIVVRTGAP